MGFMDNKRFMERLRKMDPDTLGAFDAMLNEEADYAIKSYIRDMRMGAEKEQGQANLALGREGMERQYGFREKALDTRSDIALRGLQQRGDIETARMTQRGDIASRDIASDLERRQNVMDFQEKQANIALPIGLANVGVSGLLGYQKAKKDEELANIYRTLAGKYQV